jgi:histidyl-tRNA synthetase
MSDSKPLSTESYKGVRDFYPEEYALRRAVFEKIGTALRERGYQQYDASPLEPSELYESKGNEEIIREQTFSFEDRGGRRVTLRPEMTPTLARMVAHKRRELVFPLRWFSIGNRFRYERPQRGRLREFYQTDVDFIGLPQGEADFEIIELADRIMKVFGAKESDFIVRVNSRKLLRSGSAAAGHSEEVSREYLRLLDRKEKISAEEYATELARLGDSDPMSIIENAVDDEIALERERVQEVVNELKKRGVTNAVYDPALTRGFDYYTGTVFEIFDTNSENPRALFGGGRYDALVSMFGGDPIPAIGFAFGDVTFIDFLETHNILPRIEDAPLLHIGTPESTDGASARVFQNTFVQGVSSTLNLSEKSLGDQIKEAHRRGTPFFIAYGKNEDVSKIVRIKTLSTGEETEVQKEGVSDFLITHIS